MKSSSGEPSFPIWLIADSEPENWRRLLQTPLDPRHPARHNIWTAILEYIQDDLYKEEKLRLEGQKLFVRNAILDPADKPESNKANWTDKLQAEMSSLRKNLLDYNPKIVLTFGAFAFEFLRRVHREQPFYPYSHWTTTELGKEFRIRATSYDNARLNIIPLLHASISRGRFLESHRYFVGEGIKNSPNYFEYVGHKLAKIFLNYLQHEPIWVQ